MPDSENVGGRRNRSCSLNSSRSLCELPEVRNCGGVYRICGIEVVSNDPAREPPAAVRDSGLIACSFRSALVRSRLHRRCAQAGEPG